MPAELISIADAVVSVLNNAPAGTFPQAFTAARHYTPDFKLADMSALHVSVVPRGLARKRLTRSEFQFDYQVDIGIQQRAVDAANQQVIDDFCDELMLLTEKIADYLAVTKLADYPAAIPVEAENSPVFDPDGLQEKRLFTSVITQAYRLSR